MAVALRHVLAQGPMIVALGRIATSGWRGLASRSLPCVPGPWIEARLPPPSPSLVRDYVRHVGGDPATYRGRIPAHLFPQWGLPLAARALEVLPYPLRRVVNVGCRIENRGPLPVGEHLEVRARIESVDDDGRRAVVTQRITTGTSSAPDAVIADVRALVPLVPHPRGAAPRASSTGRTVPLAGDVRELAFSRLERDAGLAFAAFTGDFNPIHWVSRYARASGFAACILHGFSTLARAVEAVHQGRLCGDPSRLKIVDAAFTRPLLLPASVGVYVTGEGSVWVGDAPGGRAYLEGRFETGVNR